ncbi:hypothetical protein TNIN_172081 [Trichonephila inaurata madagascariensis]|uniref:Uncharacterized protein n=1 Tax=Trichonephila inaurata madagascariensis TaxID=2747483 RepID=A0A8X6M9J0_9ARAC|nr:hypothetical protein TNIN_172081 [Trichonephila inaurata madagascariensis]
MLKLNEIQVTSLRGCMKRVPMGPVFTRSNCLTPLEVKIRLIEHGQGSAINFDYSRLELMACCIELRGWFTQCLLLWIYQFKIVAWVTQWCWHCGG